MPGSLVLRSTVGRHLRRQAGRQARTNWWPRRNPRPGGVL